MAIGSFRHAGLAEFARTGSPRRLPVRNVARLRRMLAALEAAVVPEDLDLPGCYFHGLSGRKAGVWSLRVSANWRLTFEWDGADAVHVDLEDYH